MACRFTTQKALKVKFNILVQESDNNKVRPTLRIPDLSLALRLAWALVFFPTLSKAGICNRLWASVYTSAFFHPKNGLNSQEIAHISGKLGKGQKNYWLWGEENAANERLVAVFDPEIDPILNK